MEDCKIPSSGDDDVYIVHCTHCVCIILHSGPSRCGHTVDLSNLFVI